MEYIAEEGDNRIGFIMVLSHSGPTESAIFPKKISSKFPVHTFSLEHSSYHSPEVMKHIADKTSGTYSFIDVDMRDLEVNRWGINDNKDTSYIKGAFELLIGGIKKVAATSIKITLAAHEGVDITAIESGGYTSRVNSEGRTGEIDINDLYAGETKNFIVRLKLTEGKGKLVSIGGQYQSLDASKQLFADTDVFVLRPRSGCSPEKLAMHPEVAAELLRVQLTNGLSAMLDDLPIRNHMERLRYKIKSSALGRCAPQETLADFLKNMAEMHKKIRKYKVPYVLSWLSCHEWQRANTKGAYSDSGDFMPKC